MFDPNKIKIIFFIKNGKNWKQVDSEEYEKYKGEKMLRLTIWTKGEQNE